MSISTADPALARDRQPDPDAALEASIRANHAKARQFHNAYAEIRSKADLYAMVAGSGARAVTDLLERIKLCDPSSWPDPRN